MGFRISCIVGVPFCSSTTFFLFALFFAKRASLLACFNTALLFLKIYTQSGESQENLEGITMLIAAAVLFYVSYWLTSKAEAARWMDYIQNQVMQSIGKGSIFTLGLASFFVVYREGAETILFYSALFSNAEAGGSGRSKYHKQTRSALSCE